MFEYDINDHAKLLANYMKRMRAYYDMTQESLAAKTKLSNKTVQNIEECSTDPRLSSVVQICRTLDLDPREFICPDKIAEPQHIAELGQVIADCNEQEAAVLISAIKAMKKVMRLNQPHDNIYPSNIEE